MGLNQQSVEETVKEEYPASECLKEDHYKNNPDYRKYGTLHERLVKLCEQVVELNIAAEAPCYEYTDGEERKDQGKELAEIVRNAFFNEKIVPYIERRMQIYGAVGATIDPEQAKITLKKNIEYEENKWIAHVYCSVPVTYYIEERLAPRREKILKDTRYDIDQLRKKEESITNKVVSTSKRSETNRKRAKEREEQEDKKNTRKLFVWFSVAGSILLLGVLSQLVCTTCSSCAAIVGGVGSAVNSQTQEASPTDSTNKQHYITP